MAEATSRWRLDALAIALAIGWLITVGCLIGYQPLTGLKPMFGQAGVQIAKQLVDALGVAVVTLMLFWLIGIRWYVVRKHWLPMLLRGAGWLILLASTSGLADFAMTYFALSTPAVFGLGGSIGAGIRFASQDRLISPLPWVSLVGICLIGIVLVADGLIRRGLGWASLGNSWIARQGDRLLNTSSNAISRFQTWRTKAHDAVIELTPMEKLGTAILSVKAPAILQEVTNSTGDIPITRPVDLSQTPPPLRVLPQIEDDAPEPYELPSLSLLADPDSFPVADHEQKLRERASLLEKTFQDFNLVVKVVGIHTGPVITQYEIALDTGIRLNKVTTLADDLALSLSVSAVRIVAPLPGRNTVGIEVPNEHRHTVRLKEIIHATAAKSVKFKLPIYLGKDVEGRPLVYDMATMPHLLIAGRTGTGKSVCLNSVILSLLLTRLPSEARLILIDPKKVELSEYGKVPHLMHPVVTDDKKAEAILAWAVDKMEERYELLRRARVRNIHSYNELAWDDVIKRIDPASEEERKQIPRQMPYIVIVVDEVGDLLMSMKKEVETHIIRLAQKSRASGIHLILATQKPTVDVITGLIKSNLPARICFQVASRADSAVVLDEKGAEKLLGMGDMLFLQPGTSTIIRAQGAYVDDREIERVVGALEVHEPNYESELLNLKAKEASGAGAGGDFNEKLRQRDALYEQAIEIVIREQRGSTSLLQRAMGIGYGRASRLIDFMAEDGIVGGYNGSNARDVLVSHEEWQLKKTGA